MDPNGLSGGPSQQGGGEQGGNGSQQGDGSQQNNAEQNGGSGQGGSNEQGGEQGGGAEKREATQQPKLPADPPTRRQLFPVRVLVKCEHGKPDDVVELTERAARAASRAGQVCGHPESVEYALALKRKR